MIQQRFCNSKGQHCVVVPLHVGQLETNCYIVSLDSDAYIIDPGDDGTYIAETVQSLCVVPRAILLTHGHFDHMLGAFEVAAAFTIPTFMSRYDLPIVERMRETTKHFLQYTNIDPAPHITVIEESLNIFTQWHIHCISLPGHTPGSVAFEFIDYPILFVGDTVFAHGLVGDTSHTYSDATQLSSSIRSILAFPEKTTIYSGHGEESTIKALKQDFIHTKYR